jgi:hypothetical protein
VWLNFEAKVLGSTVFAKRNVNLPSSMVLTCWYNNVSTNHEPVLKEYVLRTLKLELPIHHHHHHIHHLHLYSLRKGCGSSTAPA